MHRQITNSVEARRIIVWIVFCVLAAATLSGCRESSTDDDDSGAGADPGGIPTQQLTLAASSTQLPSNGSTPVTITALVRDDNNNVVTGEPVSFSASGGALTVIGGVTDASGQAFAELVPVEFQNQTLTVTATHEGNVATVDVNVVGTELTVDGPDALADGATGTWTVTLKDSGGDGIDGEVVTITSTQGNTLTTGVVTTGPSGQVQFDLTANAGLVPDTLVVSALGETATATVNISGDRFEFTTPSNGTEVDLGTPETLTVVWEQGGLPQTGQTVNFATTRGTPSALTATTDAAGVATVDIQSDNAGPAIVSASTAGGLNATLQLEFVATNPAAITVQADPGLIGPTESSTITAIVRDPNNNLVKNANVQFRITKGTSSGSLSQPQSTTDSQGRATTVYTASNTTSGKDGVVIKAKVANTTPLVEGTTQLTVGHKALRISMNTGNTLEDTSETRYAQPWTVLVTDAGGSPVEGEPVDVSVSVLEYYKGSWIKVDTDGDGTADEWAKGYDGDNDPDHTIETVGSTHSCLNEDRRLEGVPGFENATLNGVLDTEDSNKNGVLDTGEDTNGNLLLDTEDFDGDGLLDTPTPATAVVPGGGALVTDETGFADFTLMYPKGNATWSKVRLEARVGVAGTEPTERREFVLPVLRDDVADVSIDPPGGPAGPYGVVGDCSIPD